MTIDRSEYREIYRRTFGKSMKREACRAGWEQWQKLWREDFAGMFLHPPGERPTPAESDYHIVLACGPLSFRWRVSSAEYLATLQQQWLDNSPTICRKLSVANDRSAARMFIQNALVDGLAGDVTVSSLMASGIVWLLATHEAELPLKMFHCIGFDIAYVPGPVGQDRMFNFRAILAQEYDPEIFKTPRELPLPQWRAPDAP